MKCPLSLRMSILYPIFLNTMDRILASWFESAHKENMLDLDNVEGDTGW